MAQLNVMSCNVRVVQDTNRAWVTMERGAGRATLTFWYNPYSNMTIADVVDTIESQQSPMRIGHVTVRGLVIHRQDYTKHMAQDYLKDNESFNIHLVPICCTLL